MTPRGDLLQPFRHFLAKRKRDRINGWRGGNFLSLQRRAVYSNVGRTKIPKAAVMARNSDVSNWLLGAVGGIVGGALGYFAFGFLLRQGVYAMVLPGVLLGFGCGFLSRVKSNVLGVACGLLAVLLGLFTEWRFVPFVDDGSFKYFMTHVHDLTSLTLIMITAGGFFAFLFGKGREGGSGLRRGKSDAGD